MTRRYGKKASEKVARTMHEFKRGKLRSGSGGKVTSREQAIAIGISQARRAGYKVPPWSTSHAVVSLDSRVRDYLVNMSPGQVIDARGIARALGRGVDPLEADYALERAQRAGWAVSRDGRWFGPGGDAHARKKAPRGAVTPESQCACVHAGDCDCHRRHITERCECAFCRGDKGHARKKTPPAQLEREIAQALTSPVVVTDTIKVRDRLSGNQIWLTFRDGRVVGVMGTDPSRFLGMTPIDAGYYARTGQLRSSWRKGT